MQQAAESEGTKQLEVSAGFSHTSNGIQREIDTPFPTTPKEMQGLFPCTRICSIIFCGSCFVAKNIA
jgi:hypothetical protein